MHNVPTHYAIKQADAGKVSQSINKARAVLALIQHNGLSDDDGFFSSETIIRNALDVVKDYLDKAESHFRNEPKFVDVETNND